MALWGGLEHAATAAQLLGADVGGLIFVIIQAAAKARQNKKECAYLARRVFMIAELLPHLQDPEVMRRPEIRRPLAGLDDTLREAHELVMSCQEKGAVQRLVMAARQAEKFRQVQSRIDSYLLVFPFISHMDITRRLDRIYRVLLLDDASPSSDSRIHELDHTEEIAQEVVLHVNGEEGQKFTVVELETATKNVASERLIGRGGVSNVYMGRLADGREVAIKHFPQAYYRSTEEFHAEHTILSLSHTRHDHIIRLFGCCMEIERVSWFAKKRVMNVLVFEYMKNSSLDQHLHGSLSSSSPVTTSWSMRMEILLGVSRAIEHLHNHAERPVIHRDIKLSNVLLDAAWVPRLSDFGCSVIWDERKCSHLPIVGTTGYLDPEYYATNTAKPAIDVYSFGVVMLEVLTGRKPIFVDQTEGKKHLVLFALPLIEIGEVRKVLDSRLQATEPTARQLQAAELVANTAARCVQFQGKDRPTISEIVANLQDALQLVVHGYHQ